MTTPTPAQQLEPCPFCGGINTEVREKTMWTGMRSQLINVEVHHWCDVKCGASRGHIELAAPTRDEAIAAWNQRTPNARALAALEAVECDCATKVNQVCDKCCAKTEALWLMPVATMEPQNGKLLQYAHGRSHLSTGQMAHAYQCIVEAAKECGQIIPADAVEVSRG